MQKKLIIFGCGYVGTAFATEAIHRGLRVTALTRNPEQAERLRNLGVNEVIEDDLTGESWHLKVEPGFDYAVNSISASGGGVPAYKQAYLAGMESILKWCRMGHVGTFLYTSSSGVYACADGSWVKETSLRSGKSERSRILSKAEDLLISSSRSHAHINRWFIFRLSGIYGPGRHYLVDRLTDESSGIPLVLSGSGKRWQNLIYRDDICSAIWKALNAPSQLKNEFFNLSDGHPVKRKKLSQWLAWRLNVPPPLALVMTGKKTADHHTAKTAHLTGFQIDASIIRKRKPCWVGNPGCDLSKKVTRRYCRPYLPE